MRSQHLVWMLLSATSIISNMGFVIKMVLPSVQDSPLLMLFRYCFHGLNILLVECTCKLELVGVKFYVVACTTALHDIKEIMNQLTLEFSLSKTHFVPSLLSTLLVVASYCFSFGQSLNKFGNICTTYVPSKGCLLTYQRTLSLAGMFFNAINLVDSIFTCC